MDVRDQGHIAMTGGVEPGADLSQGFRLPLAGGGDAHDLASRLNHPEGFCNGGVHIEGVGRGHGLQNDGGISTDRDPADANGSGGHPLGGGFRGVRGHGRIGTGIRMGWTRDGRPMDSVDEGNTLVRPLFFGSRAL